ncbi:hypothetical protein [Okeania sp. KiyG1]|uniref:hypothetical protein n=1 Tax=Okeania sp. KiyG1 TaxID=2720165 RepID=UPI0019224EDC|nr:hypothetical protein [Okeania sp. KiyG1]GGA22366.1 hypothetical protein CYANOKiyG1_37460 [Okeania sp. KiyG1]
MDEIKSEIGRLLTDEVQLGGLTDEREIEFLKWMAEHIPGDLENMRLGFETISAFNVSYAGIIQRQVRQYINKLTPDKNPLSLTSENAENSEKVLIKIKEIHQGVIDSCKSDLDKLLSEPKQLAYAMVAEFVDRILRPEDIKDDWDIFLNDEQVRQKVWPEFKTMANRMKIQKDWQSLVEQIIDINQLEKMRFL